MYTGEPESALCSAGDSWKGVGERGVLVSERGWRKGPFPIWKPQHFAPGEAHQKPLRRVPLASRRWMALAGRRGWRTVVLREPRRAWENLRQRRGWGPQFGVYEVAVPESPRGQSCFWRLGREWVTHSPPNLETGPREAEQELGCREEESPRRKVAPHFLGAPHTRSSLEGKKGPRACVCRGAGEEVVWKGGHPNRCGDVKKGHGL